MCHDCCICMEIITDTNKTTTECGHTFHSSCIFRKLSQRIECPMCRKELSDPSEEDEEEDDDETESNESDDSYHSYSDYQFIGEDGEIEQDRCIEFKKYATRNYLDPTLSYKQIADKMMQMGVTPADLLALYCTTLTTSEVHTEEDDDMDKYNPKKIYDIDILYRKISRGAIAVNYRDARSYADVIKQSQSNNV